MTETDRPKIVWVEWLDSNLNPGWRSKSSNAREASDLRVHSIGFLVDENDDVVSVSASWDLSTAFADAITIPKCSITNMQEVELS